eukprot:TRINITY_DN8574_c0_g1_i4.p2 TRINITY_DN8574_c0_g1~~TRINITY_DN8574_c0_g1_i4.p2  ORF type:complete len:113 (-),score=15.94 TRINITY_DN8574_c0_g1_i4:209-547(-)
MYRTHLVTDAWSYPSFFSRIFKYLTSSPDAEKGTSNLTEMGLRVHFFLSAVDSSSSSAVSCAVRPPANRLIFQMTAFSPGLYLDLPRSDRTATCNKTWAVNRKWSVTAAVSK